MTLEVLDVLGLIEHHVVPLLAAERKMILDHELVRRDAHMERVFLTPSLALRLSFFLRSEVGKNLKRRAPALELHLPVDNDGSGHDDQVWTPDTAIAS